MRPLSPESIAELFDRHSAPLELYAAQWTTLPADVVQEAFLQLVRQKRPPRQPVAWLYRVVKNGAISSARHEGRRMRNERAAMESGPLRFATDLDGALDAVSAAEALQSLPDDKREVVVARIWGGLAFEEIAEIAGISSSEAHRRYEAGLAALRRKLGVTWLTRTLSTKK